MIIINLYYFIIINLLQTVANYLPFIVIIMVIIIFAIMQFNY